MIVGHTLPVGTWLIGLFVHLVLLQSAYELESMEDAIVMDDLGHYVPSSAVADEDKASRVVLFVVSGLRADVYNFRGNNSAFYWELSRALGLNGLCRPPWIASAKMRLQEMLSGADVSPQQVETVFDHSEGFFVGPPSLILRNVKHNFTFQHEWENATIYPFPRSLDELVFENSKKAILQSRNNNLSKKFFVIYFFGYEVASNLKGEFSNFAVNELLFLLERVQDIYKIMENTYQDSRTSYIFTSDHLFPCRPTEWGDYLSQHVPFVTWGFGFSKVLNLVNDNENYKEIKAKDIAPLTSTLMGTQIPNHSFGVVPLKCLSEKKLQADSLLQNALQLSHLCFKFEEKLGYSWARFFSPVNSSSIIQICEGIRNSISIGDFDSAIFKGRVVINLSLFGIDYFSNFNYRNLLMSTFISLIGWVIVTSFWVLSRVKLVPVFEMEIYPQPDESERAAHYQARVFQKFLNYENIVNVCGTLILVIVSISLLLYQFPLNVGASFILTLVVFWLITRYFVKFIRVYKRLKSVKYQSSKAKFFIHLFFTSFWTLLYPFKIVDSLFILWACACSCTTDLRKKSVSYCSYWILSALPFSILMFSDNSVIDEHIFLSGVTMWLISSFYLALFLNAKFIDWILIFIYQFFLVTSVIKHFCGIVLTWSVEWWFSWIPIGMLTLIPFIGSSKLPLRLLQISLGISLYFFNFSYTFEPVASYITVVHLLSWILIESQDGIVTFLNSTTDNQGSTTILRWSDFRITFYYFVYLLMSFLVIDPFYNFWPNDSSSNFTVGREGLLVIFLKVFPVTLLVNVTKTAICKNFCTIRIHLELLVSACFCLFNLVFIPGSHQNTCIQMLLFCSIASEPLSVLLLSPSLMEKIRKRQIDNVTVIHFETKNEKAESNL